jgi:hypothetical protein
VHVHTSAVQSCKSGAGLSAAPVIVRTSGPLLLVLLLSLAAG